MTYLFIETYSTGELYTYSSDVFDNFQEATTFVKQEITKEHSILKNEGISWKRTDKRIE